MISTGHASDVRVTEDRNRVLSIDFFRGLVMFILVSGIGTLFADLAREGKGGDIISFINRQCDHGQWFELYFWDLIQPFFMFIVGVSMPFSFSKRAEKGETWRQSFLHVLKRSALLLFFGFMLGAKTNAFYLTNILPQLSLVYLVAFLLMRKPAGTQLIISFLLILVSDLLYRFWPVAGFNQPYVPDHNFGTWVDSVTTGHIHPYHWVTFNAIPTAAHTIWGVLTGYLLMKDWSQKSKLLIMFSAGIGGVVAGHLLGLVVPIVERTGTGSYVIVTGGWSLIAMAVSFLLIDMLKLEKTAKFFAIVGMNPIFIYIFASLGGRDLLTRMVTPFTSRIFSWSGTIVINMITIIAVAGLMWYISYFLYKRKIFIKL